MKVTNPNPRINTPTKKTFHTEHSLQITNPNGYNPGVISLDVPGSSSKIMDKVQYNNLYTLNQNGSHELIKSPKKHSNLQSQAQTQQNVVVKRLMELQGECKIKQYEYIRFNFIQSVFAIFILVITVFGLFALKYSAWFRRKVFFDTVTQVQEATHVFVTGNDRKSDIVKVINPKSQTIYFLYKKLKYVIMAEANGNEINEVVSNIRRGKPIPVGYQFQKQFRHCFDTQRIIKGLNSQQVRQKKQLYGLNQHLVQMPSYPEYLIDVLTEPFFLLQYFFCFIFFIQGYAPFSFALLFFSFVTTTVNYVMLYVSYKRIKSIAEKISQVDVIRNGQKIKLDSRELVPGDVYIPQNQEEIPADCIQGLGDVYVNEANLTGQSFQLASSKYRILGKQKTQVFGFIKDLNTFAVVINTGFGTHRGRILRKILNRTIKDPDILRTTLIFVFEVVFVSIITLFAILYLLLERDIEKVFVFFKAIDFLASSAPPTLPIFFNLAYSLSLFRLSFKGITGTQPQKTVDGAQIKTFCFDKTGTITKSTVNIMKIFKLKITNALSFNNIIQQLGQTENNLIWKLFATCHTTKLIKQQLLGDQIDKQMFKFINAKMENTTDPNIRLIVKSTKQFQNDISNITESLQIGRQKQDRNKIVKRRQSLLKMECEQHLQILRINQFESSFQSMSVLVRDVINNKHYIFVKGSPEKILKTSCNIMRSTNSKTYPDMNNNSERRQRQKQKERHNQKSLNYESYMNMLKNLSLNGLRTIGMGYKQLHTRQQIQHYLKSDRQQFLQNIKNLGLIAFENGLKNDAWITINKLKNSNIQNKIITGDNIYIAVQTARRAGIIEDEQVVVFLEGSKNANLNQEIINDGNLNNHMYMGTIVHKPKNNTSSSALAQHPKVQQQDILIHQNNDYLGSSSKYIFAVDNSFITMQPKPVLSHRIKVFARIPPENKAYIIQKYKQQHNQYLRSHYSKFSIWLKTNKWKIGMCGDGANDLLALREADLSVGIQATDASYGSSFTVKNLLDVDWIIKQSKCTQANIVQLYQFYGSMALIILFASIILITDVTYLSTAQLMYLNFGTVLLIPGTIAMTRPSQQQSQYVPDINMLGLHNQLIFWGNTLIPFFGILGAWFFFSNTSEYQPNPKPSASVAGGGFNSNTYSTTLVFILLIMISAFNALIIYRSKPWRQRFFRNYLFTLLIMLNIAVAFVFAFVTQYFESSLQFKQISHLNMGISIGILFGSLLLNLIYNLIIDCFKLDHRLLRVDDIDQAARNNGESNQVNNSKVFQLQKQNRKQMGINLNSIIMNDKGNNNSNRNTDYNYNNSMNISDLKTNSKNTINVEYITDYNDNGVQRDNKNGNGNMNTYTHSDINVVINSNSNVNSYSNIRSNSNNSATNVNSSSNRSRNKNKSRTNTNIL